jgi:hypothetical protein
MTALAQQGIQVHTTEPSFLGRGRFWVDDEHYSIARQLTERIALSAGRRRVRRESTASQDSRQAKSRWLDAGVWLAVVAVLLMLALFLGLPLLAALGVR